MAAKSKLKDFLFKVYLFALAAGLCAGGAYFAYDSYKDYRKYSRPPVAIDLNRDPISIPELSAWVELSKYTPLCDQARIKVSGTRRLGNQTYYLPIRDAKSETLVILYHNSPIACDLTGDHKMQGKISRGRGTPLIDEYLPIVSQYHPERVYHLCLYCKRSNSLLGIILSSMGVLAGILLFLAAGFFRDSRKPTRSKD